MWRTDAVSAHRVCVGEREFAVRVLHRGGQRAADKAAAGNGRKIVNALDAGFDVESLQHTEPE